MPTSNGSMSATQAVDEATRSISDTSQHGIAYAQRALTSTTAYLADALAFNPQPVKGAATDVEAIVKTGFGLQNTILAALPPLVEAGFGATRSVLEGYTTMVEQQQKILLGAWKRVVVTAERKAPHTT